MLAGIVAAMDLAVLVADEHHVGIVRVEQDRPDRQAVVGDVHLLPVLAAVVAAIRAGLRAGIDDLGCQRMHRQRADRRRVGQAVVQRLPFVAAVGEAVEAGVHLAAATGFTGEAQVDKGTLVVLAVGCHRGRLQFSARSAWQGLCVNRKARSLRWTEIHGRRIRVVVAKRVASSGVQAVVAAAMVCHVDHRGSRPSTPSQLRDRNRTRSGPGLDCATERALRGGATGG